MIPKSGNRFSGKIMRKEKARMADATAEGNRGGFSLENRLKRGLRGLRQDLLR
jgi:hypothetical protein